MTAETGYQGTQRPGDDGNSYNAYNFLIRSFLQQMNIGTIVQIVAVTNSGGLSPVGFVDVQPLVNQLAGDLTSTPHAVVYGLPYFRLQGGADAIILDPKVGDLGIAIFADRDISAVKAIKAQANPGSGRRNSMADGMYIGGLLNGTPTQYLQFSGAGINVVSPTKITLSAPNVEIDATTKLQITTPTSETDAAVILLNGNVTQTTGTGSAGVTLQGPVHVNTEVTAQTTPLHTHAHTGVTPGASNTGGPTP